MKSWTDRLLIDTKSVVPMSIYFRRDSGVWICLVSFSTSHHIFTWKKTNDKTQAVLQSFRTRLKGGQVRSIHELECIECAGPSEAAANDTTTDILIAHSNNVDITKGGGRGCNRRGKSAACGAGFRCHSRARFVLCSVPKSNDLDTRNFIAHSNENVERFDEGIGGDFTLRQKTNQGKLARFLHHGQDELVVTSILPGFDDSEFRLSQVSDTRSKPICQLKTCFTHVVAKTTGGTAQFPTSQGQSQA